MRDTVRQKVVSLAEIATATSDTIDYTRGKNGIVNIEQDVSNKDETVPRLDGDSEPLKAKPIRDEDPSFFYGTAS